MEKRKILIVEDEYITAEDIKEKLKSVGYKVIGIASTYNKVLELIDNNMPDLVLMDIKIKGDKNGIETANYVRRHYDIPIIFLTAFSDKKLIEQVKNTEPYGYIIKPFTKEGLYSNIEIALNKDQRIKYRYQVLFDECKEPIS